MRRIAPLLVLLTLVVACQDHGDLTSPRTASRALMDGSTGGNPHFYFLPPLAAEPDAVGEFDAEADPRVEVCEWEASACSAVIASFDTDGAGAERVRADGSEGHYIVNWDTRQSPLEAGSAYRIRVLVDGEELGFVDALAVSRGRQLSGVDAEQYVPLRIGRTIPIKFRIEVGASEPSTATVVGVVTGTDGSALAGVSATLQGTPVVGTSNSAGGLTLDGVRTGRTAVLRLSLDGYADQLVQLEVPGGVERVTFRTSMIQKAPPVVLSASAGGTAVSTDGAAVVLPASGLVDGQGAMVSGDVDVTITPVDVSGDGIDAFPGSFTGINADGEAGLLMTYGVAEYTFEQNGEELQLAPGQTATVIIPIYTGEAGLSLGSTIPLWYLDETTGEWIEESLGTVVALASSPTGLGLEAEVSHFSWWNIDVWVDAPYEPWVRCSADGTAVDCTVRATVDDPSFPRTNAEEFVPAAGKRLTFPPDPTVTTLSGESGNRYGMRGVSGQSGEGASDTIWVDLAESGVISPDHSVVTLSPTAVEIPGTVVFTLDGRDFNGSPMSTGGAPVRFYVEDGSGTVRSVAAGQDNGDGTYTYSYTPTEEGTFSVQGWVNGSFVTTGDPAFTVTWSATAGRGATSQLSIAPSTIDLGGTAAVTLQAFDESGTARTAGGDFVSFRVASTGALTAGGTISPVTDNGDGTYSATFTGTRAGTPVEMGATINGEVVTTGNPTIAVAPGVLTEAEANTALAAAFNLWWFSAHHINSLEWTMATMSDLGSSSWGNAAMLDMSSEPRQPWNNDPTYTYSNQSLLPWLLAYRATSRAYDVLRSLDDGLQMGGGADNARARAAAKLVQGLAHAQLALTFDQAFILDESMDVSTATLSLQPYPVVRDAALAYLAEAISIADANTFTLPADWIEGAPLTSIELSQVAHSYSARLMAAAARTPAEREAADWAAIASHIDQGITTDFGPVANGTNWYDYFKAYVHNRDWFRGDYRSIGGVTPNDPETDPDGAFAAWLATPVADRMPYATQTADRRIWDGTFDGSGNPNPGTYFAFNPAIRFPADRGTYHFSYYAFSRYPVGYGLNAGDFLPTVSTVEMDLLKAEALYQLGQPGVAALVNKTRVNNGQLSPATDADADILDKLAYEKRLETYHLNGALAFWDRRGWGTDLGPNEFGQGLMDGTPYHFPVPGRELERLGIPSYTFGGSYSPMGMSGRMAGMRGVPASSVYRSGEVMRLPARPIELRLDQAGPSEGLVPGRSRSRR